MEELKNYLKDEKVTNWPAKWKYRLLVLKYLADKFEVGKFYTEPEVNEIINKFHTFDDSALLRREMYENKFLDRERNGGKYWKC